MIVFFDTTEFRMNPNAQGANWEKLGQFFVRDLHTGIVTDLVADETVNHFSEDLIRIRDAMASHVSHLKRLSCEELATPEIDVERLLTAFRERFEARLKQLHLHKKGYDNTSVQHLVQRALRRQKPFDANGQKGFRDAVQWEIILAAAHDSPDTIVFITRNKRDFGPHGSLADELEAELIEIDRPGAVRICETLDSFIQEFVDPTLEQLNDIAVAIGEGSYRGFCTDDFIAGLWRDIESAIRDEVSRNGLRDLDYIVRHYFSDPELASFDDSSVIVAGVDVFRVDDNELAVSMEIEINGTIKCQEEWTPDPAMARAPYLEDHFGDATFKVSIGIVMSEDAAEVLNENIDKVTITLGRGWPYADDD